MADRENNKNNSMTKNFVDGKLRMMSIRETMKDIPLIASDINTAVQTLMANFGINIGDNMSLADVMKMDIDTKVMNLVLKIIEKSLDS